MNFATADKSILVKRISEEELESALDMLAQDVKWTDKEIKQQNNQKTISYKTPLLDAFGRKIIECTLIPQTDGITLTIESRFLVKRSFIDLLFSFLGPIKYPYDYFDIAQNNKRNLEYIYEALKKDFGDDVSFVVANREATS